MISVTSLVGVDGCDWVELKGDPNRFWEKPTLV